MTNFDGGFGTKEIDDCLRPLRFFYDSIEAGLGNRPPGRLIRAKIKALQEAEDTIRGLENLLGRGSEWAPESLRGMRYGATLGMLQEASHFLSKMRYCGRPKDIALGTAAFQLGQLFKERTGACRWELVSQHLRRWFPEAVPDDGEDRGGRLWAYRLAKRHKTDLVSDDAIYKAFLPIIWGKFSSQPTAKVKPRNNPPLGINA